MRGPSEIHWSTAGHPIDRELAKCGCEANLEIRYYNFVWRIGIVLGRGDAGASLIGFDGRLAQRLERSVYTRKVEGSNPSVPTIFRCSLLR